MFPFFPSLFFSLFFPFCSLVFSFLPPLVTAAFSAQTKTGFSRTVGRSLVSIGSSIMCGCGCRRDRLCGISRQVVRSRRWFDNWQSSNKSLAFAGWLRHLFPTIAAGPINFQVFRVLHVILDLRSNSYCLTFRGARLKLSVQAKKLTPLCIFCSMPPQDLAVSYIK